MTSKDDPKILSRCDDLGLHPASDPLGDDHHTDVAFTEEDKAKGDVLAYFMGSLFCDVDGKDSPYWYYQRTSVDEWARVARALRIHGLKIVDAGDEPQ